MATRIQATYSRAVTFNRAALTWPWPHARPGRRPRRRPGEDRVRLRGRREGRVLSYTANKDRTQFKNLKVDIERGGALLLTTTLPKYKDFWPGGAIDDSSIDVRDLDGDGEPEVQVKLYSGGANCCLSGLVYSYRAATNS